MKNKPLFFLETCHGLFIVLSILSIPIFLLFPENGMLYLLRAFILLIPLIATAITVNNCSYLLPYLGVGIISSIIVFYFAQNTVEQVYLILFSVLIIILRIPARLSLKKDFLQTPFSMCPLLFFAVYLLGIVLHLEPIRNLMYFFSFGYIILLILHKNLSGIDQYLTEKQDFSNFPGYQIVHTNRVMLIIFIGIAIFFFLLFPLTQIESFFLELGRQFLNFLRWLISLLLTETANETSIAETLEATKRNPSTLPAIDPAPEWLRNLLQFLCTLIFIAGCVLFILCTFYMIYQLFQRFYRPHPETDDRHEFIKEEIQLIPQLHRKKKKNEHSLYFQFHPNAYIRKRYKKEIKKRIDFSKEIPSHYTPTELEKYANLPPTNESEILHQLYEKARYSEQGCKKEEIIAIKQNIERNR